MYLVPEVSGNTYKNSGSYNGGYTVPSSDVSASDAVGSTEGGSPSKAMLERFIKEVKINNLYGGSGPQGKAMIGSMQKERMNPEHLAGFEAGQLLGEQLKLAEMMVTQYLGIVGDHANATNFGKWLEDIDDAGARLVKALIQSWRTSDAVLDRLDNMVRYLDMERRQKYVIEPGTDGLFYSREATESTVKFERVPFDTSKSTAAVRGSGKGQAIWVQGPSGRFYSSNESECGKFHHSSFLAGRDVKSAGDWVIQEGRLKAISAMSGHYHPTLDSLRKALLDLQSTSRQLLNFGVVEVFKGATEVKIPIRTFLDESAKDSKYLAQYTPFQA